MIIFGEIVLTIFIVVSLWFLAGSLAYLGAQELKKVYNFRFPEIYDDDDRREYFSMGPIVFISVYSRGIYILFMWRPFRIIRNIFRFCRKTYIETEQDIGTREERARIKKGWDR